MSNIPKRSIRIGAASGVAAAALMASAMAALAHPAPFTVTAGAAALGTTIPVTAVAAAVSIKDTSTGVTLPTCASARVDGALSVGSGLAAGSIVELDGASSTWTDCLGLPG